MTGAPAPPPGRRAGDFRESREGPDWQPQEQKITSAICHYPEVAYSQTARITVPQPIPRSACTRGTLVASWPTRRQASTLARSVSTAHPSRRRARDRPGAIGALHVFCAVLAFSRVRFARFADNGRADTTPAMLAECFETLGGCQRWSSPDRMGCFL
jgi:hypothetical protein